MATPSDFQHALVLTGPTGSGKSALAVALAPALNAEIMSLDSMALYRGMDIGTAKPTREERAAVPHHLIDIRDPSQPYRYLRTGRASRIPSRTTTDPPVRTHRYG